MGSAALAAVVLASCSSPSTVPQSSASASSAVVVASFNFPESELLADIYADVLEHAGIPVRRELDLGTREMVLPALHQGLVDVVPEYLGSALAALDPTAETRAAPTEVDERSRLGALLFPWHVQVLTPAAAQNQNGLAVTAATAQRFHLSTIGDLAPYASRLTLGGPSECPTRPYCLIGFQSVYGLQFARFLPFDQEDQRVTALEEKVADVAVMFTTDGVLATGRFVLLADDRHLQPPENIAPFVSNRVVQTYGPRLVAPLEDVSARLTTADLVFLNWRIGPGGKDIAAEARGWLERQGVVPRS